MTPQKLTLTVGVTLIFITDAAALIGVAYNRSGEPESRLSLSQRELGRPWTAPRNKENSGLSLTLNWRVPDPDVDSYAFGFSPYGGSPDWLDEKRLADLGFDIQRAKGDVARREKYISHSRRQVLVVLELAGPTWQQALARARQRLAHQVSLLQASPGSKALEEAETRARESVVREETTNSRLFAVDVGTDLAALRAKYPDRTRNMILEGTLRLSHTLHDNTYAVTGRLDNLRIDRINVPHSLRGFFETLSIATSGPAEQRQPFRATMAVGRRLEPWIEAVTAP